MAEELRYQVILDSSTATAGLRSLAGEQKRFTDSVEESSQVMGGFLGKLNAQAQAMSQARAATQGLRDMGRSLLLAGAGGTALTASFITAAASVERMKVGLKAVAGSSAEAERQFQSLLKLAESPAFTLESALTGSTRLQQAGFSAQQAEQALKGLGAAMVAAGKGPEELNRASLALSQIALKGRVSAEEIMQLAEAGVPAMAILREQFQLTGKDFNDLAGTFEKKGISANQVILTLTDTLQTKFGAAAAGAGDTATNAFSNFSDALLRARAALGENLLGPVKSALGVFTEFLKNVENWSPALKDAAGTAVLAGSALSTVGGTALTVAAQVAQIRLYYHMTQGAAGATQAATALGGLGQAAAFITTGALGIGLSAVAGGLVIVAANVIALKGDVDQLNQSLDAMNGFMAEYERRGAILAAQFRGPRPRWWEYVIPGEQAGQRALREYMERGVTMTGRAPGNRRELRQQALAAPNAGGGAAGPGNIDAVIQAIQEVERANQSIRQQNQAQAQAQAQSAEAIQQQQRALAQIEPQARSTAFDFRAAAVAQQQQSQNLSATHQQMIDWERQQQQAARQQQQYWEDYARWVRTAYEERKRQAEEAWRFEQRLAEATERQVQAVETLIERQAEQRMGIRERAARWYLDVAQQAQRMGNIPAAQAFAARGRALGQAAAGMGLQMAGFNIGIGGPERAGRGIEQAIQAFQAGNFNLAGVQGVGQLIEAGLAAGERPAAMGTFQAFGGQPFQSWLPAQQVVNIYFGERALSMQADPAQVGNIIQAWMNQELLRQRATMPSG